MSLIEHEHSRCRNHCKFDSFKHVLDYGFDTCVSTNMVVESDLWNQICGIRSALIGNLIIFD